MSANRIEQLFRDYKHAGKGNLVPYFTSGFPDVATTIELIQQVDALGVTAIEIGIPYSDSIADGPTIQASFNDVLGRGQSLEETFRLVSRVRSSVRCGIVAMVSYSIVYRHGTGPFMDHASAAGFDGVILPDVPVEESSTVSAAAHRAGLCHIGLVAPTTSPARRETIARAASGFLYQIAVAGTTGERATLPPGLPSDVVELRRISRLPVCVGFGISNAGQVREVCGFADGAIVGSAVVRHLGEGRKRGLTGKPLVEFASRFISDLMTGLTPRSR